MIAPNYIKTDKLIKLLDDLIEEEQGQPKPISLPILYQIAVLIRLVTGKKIEPDDFDGVLDIFGLIGWEYKIKNDEINFIRK